MADELGSEYLFLARQIPSSLKLVKEIEKEESSMDQKDRLRLSLGLLPWQPPHHLLSPPHAAGIDVNQAPPVAARNAEEAGAASPNSREISSSSGKRASGGGGSDEDEDGDGARKKLRLSKEQAAVLEESFREHSTLNPKQKLALAKQLQLRPRQVEVWFQNRRARTKLKQTEVDCELLRRCCQELTEENRRLQKEVQELRALKLSPQFYMHMTPPTTLTLCPSCERVSSAKNPPPPAAEQQQQHYHHRHHQFLLHHGGAAQHLLRPIRPSFLDAPAQRS